MSQDLNDQYIADTFEGLLHTSGELPASGGKDVYDGNGNRSDLSVGKFGQGVRVYSQLQSDTIISNKINSVVGVFPTLSSTNTSISNFLSAGSFRAGTLNYPNTNATPGHVLIATSPTQLALSSTIPQSVIPNSGVTAGAYAPEDIYKFSVSTKGTVTSITPITNIKTTGKLKFPITPGGRLGGSSTTYVLSSDNWTRFEFPTYTEADRNVKGAIIYIERQTTTPLTSSDYVKMRSSINPVVDTGDANTYDPAGHFCFQDSSGNLIGRQFITSVNYDGSSTCSFWLRDQGPTNSEWFLSVQSIMY